MKKCPECSDQYEGDPKFCPECGTPLKTEAEQPVADTDEASAVEGTDTPEKEPKRPGNRKWLLVAIVAAVVALAGAATWYLSTTTPVPDLSGRTVAQATEAIEAAGFALGEVTYDEDAEGAPGAVVAQDPEAGRRAPEGAVVDLLVAGPAPVATPDVGGLELEDAEAMLLAAGLVLGDVTEDYDAVLEAGLVISQEPSASVEAQRDTKVALVVSAGPQPIAVPDVIGKSESEATEVLQAAGFEVTSEEASNSAERGTVIAQNPSSGEAQPGATVALTVSSGVEMVRVPSVYNMTADNAKAVLRREGLVPSDIWVHGSEVVGIDLSRLDYPWGYVYSQSPRAGELVPKGTTVRFYLAYEYQ